MQFSRRMKQELQTTSWVIVNDVYMDDPQFPYPYLVGEDRLGRLIKPIRLLPSASGIATVPSLGDVVKVYQKGYVWETYGEQPPYKENLLGISAGDTKVSSDGSIYINSGEGDVIINGSNITTAFEKGGNSNLLKNSSFDIYNEFDKPYYWVIDTSILVTQDESYMGKSSVVLNITEGASPLALVSDDLIDISSTSMVFSGYIKGTNWVGSGESYLKVISQTGTGEVESTIYFNLFDTIEAVNGWCRYWVPFTVPDNTTSAKIEVYIGQGNYFYDTLRLENKLVWRYSGDYTVGEGITLTSGKVCSNETLSASDTDFSTVVNVNFTDTVSGGLILAYQDDKNYIVAEMIATKVAIYKVLDGVKTLKDDGVAVLLTDTDYELKVAVTQTDGVFSYTAYVEGVEMCSFDEADDAEADRLPFGRLGIYTDNATGIFSGFTVLQQAYVWLDKLQVEKGIQVSGWEATVYELIPEGVITSAQIGELTADMITAGRLSSIDGLTYFDLDDGVIVISNGSMGASLLTGTLDANTVDVINLDADNITAGTITGRKIQTASSGDRIVLYPATDGTYPNRMTCFDHDGSGVSIGPGSFMFYFEGAAASFMWAEEDGEWEFGGRTKLNIITQSAILKIADPTSGRAAGEYGGFGNEEYYPDYLSGLEMIHVTDGSTIFKLGRKGSTNSPNINLESNVGGAVLLNGSDPFPIGMTALKADYLGYGIPEGWLDCDGSEVERNIYPNLFNTLHKYLGECTISVASPGQLHLDGHNLQTADPIFFTLKDPDNDYLPNPLTADTVYYAIRVDSDHAKLATTVENANGDIPINTTGYSSGLFVLRREGNYDLGDGSTTFDLPNIADYMIRGG